MNQHHPKTGLAAHLSPADQSWLAGTVARNQALYSGFRMEEGDPKPTDKPGDKPDPKPTDKPGDKPDPKPAEPKAGVPAGYATDTDGNSLGYPKETPVVEMKVEEQAAYHRAHSRKHEQRANTWQTVVGDRTPDQVRADLAELDTLRRAKMSDAERAVEDAKQQGKSEGLSAGNQKLAMLAFDVSLDHVDPERRKVLVESLDLTKFVGADGVIDTDKVKTVAAQLAPRSDKDTQRTPDYGGGRRSTSASTGVNAGRSRYQERHGKKASTD